jgi:hypothetical protein
MIDHNIPLLVAIATPQWYAALVCAPELEVETPPPLVLGGKPIQLASRVKVHPWDNILDTREGDVMGRVLG